MPDFVGDDLSGSRFERIRVRPVATWLALLASGVAAAIVAWRCRRR
jgi:hypothetical protein